MLWHRTLGPFLLKWVAYRFHGLYQWKTAQQCHRCGQDAEYDGADDSCLDQARQLIGIRVPHYSCVPTSCSAEYDATGVGLVDGVVPAKDGARVP